MYTHLLISMEKGDISSYIILQYVGIIVSSLTIPLAEIAKKTEGFRFGNVKGGGVMVGGSG